MLERRYGMQLAARCYISNLVSCRLESQSGIALSSLFIPIITIVPNAKYPAGSRPSALRVSPGIGGTDTRGAR